MQRTNVYLDEAQRQALKGLAEQRAVPMAQMIREAIDAWLASQGVTVLDEDEWQSRFGRLLDRRRAFADRVVISENELAADIDDAVAEVRRLRAARRS